MRISALATQVHVSNATDVEDLDDPALGAAGSRKITVQDKHGQFRNALATAGALAFDGTPNTRLSFALTGQSIGTDPCSRVRKCTVPSANPSSYTGFGFIGPDNNTVSGQAYQIWEEISPAGAYVATICGSGTGNNNSATLANFVANWGGKTIVMGWVRDTAGNLVLYINGVAQTLAFASGGTPPTWQGSLTSSYFNVGFVIGGISYGEKFFSDVPFNLALSAADMLEIFELGGAVPERFKSGSQTALTSGSLTKGKVYRITAAGGTFTGVGSADNNVGTVFTATGTSPTWSTGALVEGGALIAPDLAIGGGLVIPDRGANALHGILTTAGVTHTQPKTVPLRVRTTTSTNGNQQFFGQVCIIANSQLLRVRARVRTNTPTVTLGTSSGGSQVVASVALSTTWKDCTIALTGGIVNSNSSLWAGSNSTDVVEWDITWEPLSP